jgi:hypothetical protein
MMAKDLTLDDIQILTWQFAEARNAMMAAGDALNVDMEALKQAHLPTLTACAREATSRMTVLYDAINANRHLFAAKGAKSKVFAGIKVGLNQGKPKVVSADGKKLDAKALHANATQHLLDAGALVKVTYKAIAAGLTALADDKLTLLGLKRVTGKDSPLVKPIDEDAAKIVDALIKQCVADDAE